MSRAPGLRRNSSSSSSGTAESYSGLSLSDSEQEEAQATGENAAGHVPAREAPSNSSARLPNSHFELVKGHKRRISQLHSTHRKLSGYQRRLHQALESNNFPPHQCRVPPNPPPLPSGQRHSAETLEAYRAAAKRANRSLAKVLYKAYPPLIEALSKEIGSATDEAIRSINGTIANQAERNQAIGVLHSHLDSAKRRIDHRSSRPRPLN